MTERVGYQYRATPQPSGTWLRSVREMKKGRAESPALIPVQLQCAKLIGSLTAPPTTPANAEPAPATATAAMPLPRFAESARALRRTPARSLRAYARAHSQCRTAAG